MTPAEIVSCKHYVPVLAARHEDMTGLQHLQPIGFFYNRRVLNTPLKVRGLLHEAARDGLISAFWWRYLSGRGAAQLQ
jgi:hypothetical protein